MLGRRAVDIERLRQLHPQTLTARQPEPLPFVNGSFRIDPKGYFEANIIPRIADGTYRLRRPSRYAAGLEEFKNTGTCLDPLICNGDGLRVDPQEQPQSGDIVVALMGPERHQHSVNYIRQHPMHVAMYGDIHSALVIKLLAAFGSEYWLIASDGSGFPLAGNQILGVVRRVTRQGWRREESGEITGPHTVSLYDGTGKFEIPQPSQDVGVAGSAYIEDETMTAHAVAGRAAFRSEVFTDDDLSTTGITVSSGGSGVCSITVPSREGVNTFEISVSGRMRRTAGTGGDSLIATLNDSAGSGSFAGISFSTWNTSATPESTSLSISCAYAPTGFGPWTIDLNFVHGGGLATFAVDETSMRLTVIEE